MFSIHLAAKVGACVEERGCWALVFYLIHHHLGLLSPKSLEKCLAREDQGRHKRRCEDGAPRGEAKKEGNANLTKTVHHGTSSVPTVTRYVPLT